MRMMTRASAIVLSLAIPAAHADPLDATDCAGNLLSDAAFNEPIIRDHTDASYGYGALANPVVRPLGGGEGYGAIVAKPETGVVHNAQELRAALASSEGSQVIYIDDNADIDLTYCHNEPWPADCFSATSRPSNCEAYTLVLPPGTTLASGRGRNGSRGARLHSRTFTDCPLIKVTGDKVRISGLRFEGPDPSSENDDATHCGGESTAIEVMASGNPERWSTELDNNEFAAWPGAGIDVAGVTGVRVHHSIFQYNRRVEHNNTCGSHNYGLGYGVVISSGGATISSNVFDHNRHDIASSGLPGSFYHATYNLSLNGAVQHSFDVHGGADRKDCTNIAGSGFVLHHNTVLQYRKPAIVIRGLPMKGMWIYKNEYGARDNYVFFHQTHASGGIHIADNRTNRVNSPGWFISFGGKSFWQWRRFDKLGMADAGIGDFDGDGAKDVLRKTDAGWSMSRSGREDWTPLNSLKDPVSRLRFGDFAGAATTDVVRDNGNFWQVSREGKGPWENLLPTSKGLSEAAIGDFSGDGKDDIFFDDATGWVIVENFAPVTRRHVAQPFKFKDLRFGNFTGDGKLDVVRSDGNTLWVWDRVSNDWSVLNGDLFGLKNLTLADFNGDGLTDFAISKHGRWFVQWNGRFGWEFLNKSDLNLKDQRIADFNGDGKADVLSRQSPDYGSQ